MLINDGKQRQTTANNGKQRQVFSQVGAFDYTLVLRAAHFAAWRGKRLGVAPRDAPDIEIALATLRAASVAPDPIGESPALPA